MKCLKHEEGFTLVEVLVATMMMLLVVFALYSMFDMTVRIFQVGNDDTKTLASARTAMDRMEREVRSSWNKDKTCDAADARGTLLEAGSSSDQIMFFNCFAGSSNPVIVRYSVSGNRLMRAQGSVAAPATLGTAEPVADLGAGGSLTLGYITASNVTITPPLTVANAGTVALVKINLNAKSGDRSQTIVNNIALRNRS